MNDGKYDRLMGALGYDVVDKLWPSRLAVYELRKDGERFIAKLPSKRGDEEDTRQLIQEWRALRRGEGIEGIPKLIAFYDETNPRFPKVTALARRSYKLDLVDQRRKLLIVIRNYLCGRVLKEGDKIVGSEAQNFVYQTVRELHKREIARLDIKASNMIIDELDRPCFIDLGDSVTNFASKKQFLDYCSTDLANMRSFFA